MPNTTTTSIVPVSSLGRKRITKESKGWADDKSTGSSYARKGIIELTNIRAVSLGIVPRRAEDVLALHLSQEGARCVKEAKRVVYHKVKNDKSTKDCQENNIRNLPYDAAVQLIYKLLGQ